MDLHGNNEGQAQDIKAMGTSEHTVLLAFTPHSELATRFRS